MCENRQAELLSTVNISARLSSITSLESTSFRHTLSRHTDRYPIFIEEPYERKNTARCVSNTGMCGRIQAAFNEARDALHRGRKPPSLEALNIRPEDGRRGGEEGMREHAGRRRLLKESGLLGHEFHPGCLIELDKGFIMHSLLSYSRSCGGT